MEEIMNGNNAEPAVFIPKPEPAPSPFPVRPGLIPTAGGDTLIRFDSAYIQEQAKVSDDAQALVEEAIELLRKASNHQRWRCRERSQIDIGILTIETQMKKAAGELASVSSALKKGADQFTELEERAASQESEINAELRRTWAFEADVWNPKPGDGPGKPGDGPGKPGDGPGTPGDGPGRPGDGGGSILPRRPVPPPRVIQPIIIYVPYPVSTPSASSSSPITFSYPDSSGGGYSSSSFGGSSFFSGSGIGSEGGLDFFSGSGIESEDGDSSNSLLNLLLAWLTQIMSGESSAA
jgi:hypothetical protein